MWKFLRTCIQGEVVEVPVDRKSVSGTQFGLETPQLKKVQGVSVEMRGSNLYLRREAVSHCVEIS